MLDHTEFSFDKDKGRHRCYCSVPSIKMKNGKSWRPSAYGKTKKEAREKLEEKLIVKEKSLNTPESKDILKVAIREYNNLTAITKKNVPSTIEYLNRVLKNQIEPYEIADMLVSEVEHDDVVDFIRDLSEAGVSVAMQKKAYNVLTGFFSDYYDRNPLHNPAYGLKFSTGIKKVDIAQIMSDEELNQYFLACEDVAREYLEDGSKNPEYEPNVDLLEILILTYMRSGEALALTYDDVLFYDESLQIRKTISRNINGKTVVGNRTKTEASHRILKFNEIVLALLNVRQANEESKYQNWDRECYIWHSEVDLHKPMSKTALTHLNQRILKKAKITKHIRVHDLRHTGISYFLRHGSPLAEVSKRAGHSKQSITADIYSHVLDESLAIQSDREAKIAGHLIPL